MPADPLNILVGILQDRGVQYNHDALKAAYDDPASQPTIQAWIAEYLTPETLLTKEEAALCVFPAVL